MELFLEGIPSVHILFTCWLKSVNCAWAIEPHRTVCVHIILLWCCIMRWWKRRLSTHLSDQLMVEKKIARTNTRRKTEHGADVRSLINIMFLCTEWLREHSSGEKQRLKPQVPGKSLGLEKCAAPVCLNWCLQSGVVERRLFLHCLRILHAVRFTCFVFFL